MRLVILYAAIVFLSLSYRYNVTLNLQRIFEIHPASTSDDRKYGRRRHGFRRKDQKKNDSLYLHQLAKRNIRPQMSYPPLSALLSKDNNVTANVEHLLDFAIVGFAKTGTTELAKRYFMKHPEVAMPPREVQLLSKHEPAAEMVKLLHDLKPGEDYKRGYKSPQDISEAYALDLFDQLWPSAKLIVGVRHPVDWFSSYYNFKLRQGKPMPPAELLDGECLHQIPSSTERQEIFVNKLGRLNCGGVCADLARFHVRLSWMGKTNVTDPAEDALLGPSRRFRLCSRAPIHNPVFLYELSQLADQNETRQERFRSDLQAFVGLSTPFRVKPMNKQSLKDKNKFNICDEKYTSLRKTLMQAGIQASTWIRTYFMNHAEVTISSPEFFKAALSRWHVDPCDQKYNK